MKFDKFLECLDEVFLLLKKSFTRPGEYHYLDGFAACNLAIKTFSKYLNNAENSDIYHVVAHHIHFLFDDMFQFIQDNFEKIQSVTFILDWKELAINSYRLTQVLVKKDVGEILDSCQLTLLGHIQRNHWLPYDEILDLFVEKKHLLKNPTIECIYFLFRIFKKEFFPEKNYLIWRDIFKEFFEGIKHSNFLEDILLFVHHYINHENSKKIGMAQLFHQILPSDFFEKILNDGSYKENFIFNYFVLLLDLQLNKILSIDDVFVIIFKIFENSHCKKIPDAYCFIESIDPRHILQKKIVSVLLTSILENERKKVSYSFNHQFKKNYFFSSIPTCKTVFEEYLYYIKISLCKLYPLLPEINPTTLYQLADETIRNEVEEFVENVTRKAFLKDTGQKNLLVGKEAMLHAAINKGVNFLKANKVAVGSTVTWPLYSSKGLFKKPIFEKAFLEIITDAAKQEMFGEYMKSQLPIVSKKAEESAIQIYRDALSSQSIRIQMQVK